MTDQGTAPPRGRPIRRRILIGAALVTLVAGVLAALSLAGVLGGGNGESADAGAPREVGVQELRDFARSSPSPVYWAGVIPGRRLELTETGDGNVYVRYLTGDGVVGDGRPAFTTIGSYPVDGAYREVRRRSGAKGMQSRPAPGGGLATWSAEHPSSIYMGFPGSDLLVEVYDPDARRARALALSGEVGPVR